MSFPPITTDQPPVRKAPQPSALKQEREEERVDPVAVRRITPFVRPQINPDQLPPDYLVSTEGTSVGGLCLVASYICSLVLVVLGFTLKVYPVTKRPVLIDPLKCGRLPWYIPEQCCLSTQSKKDRYIT